MEATRGDVSAAYLNRICPSARRNAKLVRAR
jgi:hypothetical protein